MFSAHQEWKFTIVLLTFVCSSQCVFATEDDIEPPPVANAQGDGVFMIDESNFDRWVFQGSGTAASALARINSHLKLKLDELVRVCNLTEDQQQKLKLAARGDVKHFFDQVEVVRRKFLEVKNDQQAFNAIWRDINPLQQRQQVGLFGESSLFAKTIRRCLTDEQQRQYRVVTDERRRFRYRACIESSLITIGNTVGLKADQHEALAQLLIEETQPPLAFGTCDQHVVQYALSKVPTLKLKGILDDRQWKKLQPQLDQGRGMEGFLAQNGVIDVPKGAAANPGVMGRIGVFFGELRGAAVEAVEIRADVIEIRIDAVKAPIDAPADASNPDQPKKDSSNE